MSSEHFEILVIGGGQAGLAMGWHLRRQWRSFAILEAASRVGDSWRGRWDSLRLFTPARFSGLPEMPFPGEDFVFPTKDEAADYLEDYAGRFELPIRFECRVTRLAHDGRRFVVDAGSQTFSCDRVVVATGAFSGPYMPDFASNLDPAIVQLHSSQYRNAAQLPVGDLLVVGAGNSGAEIAIEAAGSGRRVWLAGRDTGRIPADVLGRLFGGRLYWWVISRLLSESTPVGRKVKAEALSRGTPLIGVKPVEIAAAGVTRVPRVTGIADGRPCLDDGRALDVAGVVWATGFRPDYRWIELPALDQEGRPVHKRGIVRGVPGLYFLGLHFQYALTSALLGGVGQDAAYLAEHISRTIHGAKSGSPAAVR